MRPVSVDPAQLEALEKGLSTHFGFSAFREGQADVVDDVLRGKNTVVVMPTGAGKSLCFQLPAMLLEGTALVVSPLIALMQDQVDALTARGIPATFINSSIGDGERAARTRAMREGRYKLVYVAPERFKSEAFVQAVLESHVSLYAIDEAHCISQWGHDFRPDYALLGQVRKRLRPPRTVALTATATPEVRDDIVKVLLLKDPTIHVAGFDRPNLFLEVTQVSGDDDKRRAAVALAREAGSGIVYCSTRKQAEGLYEHLAKSGVDAVLYHAGLEDEERRLAQERFMQSKTAVAVATNAFGMGIDKPSLRFVAHAGIPRAVEAYYQEIGRAGRDGQPARAVLLFNHADVYTQERLIQSNFPSETLFVDLWNALRHLEVFDKGVHLLASQVGASEFEVSAALKVLEREGLLARGGKGEGHYEVRVLPSAEGHHARNADARTLLGSLRSTIPHAGRVSAELSTLGARAGLDEETARHALSLLEKAKVVAVKRPFAGRVVTVLRHESWRELGVDLTRLRRQEQGQLLLLKRMTDYAYSKRCRRAFVLRYFGEDAHFGQSCGACDVCQGARLVIPEKEPREKGTALKVLPDQYSHFAAEELKRFRRELAQDLGVPPFIIFNDQTLFSLAAALPANQEEFLRVKGTGPSRWERFGPKILDLCRLARAAGDVPQRTAVAVKRRR